MVKQWEAAELPLNLTTEGRGRPRIILEPGKAIRRQVSSKTTSNIYEKTFQQQGRPDYHAAVRTVDGVRYLYIWRDPLPEGDTQ